MYLFTFRETASPEMRGFRKTRILPSIFALHPKKKQISEKEWAEIRKEAEKRFEAAREQFEKVNDRVLKEVDKKKMSFSDSKTDEYIYRRYKELGAPSTNMANLLGEVLKEKGFKIIGPQELTFHVPLDPIEKSVAEGMPLFVNPFARLDLSNALSTLGLYGLATGDITIAFSKR